MPFDLLPALDIRGSRVVRLRQGDFERETVFSMSPFETARRLVGEGARWIHAVDLDGARGDQPQTRLLADLMSATPDVAWQVGGGLRTEQSVAEMFSAGATRVVAGTALLADPEFARAIVARHGSDRIVAAIDVRDGQAVGDGWRTGAAGAPFKRALSTLRAEGIGVFAITAIDRDGLLGGPDLTLLREAVEIARDRHVIASGGIRSIEDIRAVREIGCAGAIVGRALYEGGLSLADALKASVAPPL